LDNCIICGSSEFKYVGKPRVCNEFPGIRERNYSIMQCKSCKYYFVNPPIDLSQEEWQAFYENDYFETDNKTQWLIDLNKRENAERINYILQNLKIEKGKFLDLGCGEGYMLKEAEISGFETYGLDIAYNINPEVAGKCNFFKVNLSEAKYPDNSFSVVYMDSVLEHVPDPVQTMNEIKRILKPGGLLLFIVPNEDSLMNSFTKFVYYITFNKEKYGKIKPFVTPYHVQGFNSSSLAILIRKTGLQTIFIKSFGGNYRFWKAHKTFSKQKLISLFLYPVGLLSIVTGSQVQLMSLVRK
jgi:ubiquinone/menaquinone biosynthesis C-methylase UbiE